MRYALWNVLMVGKQRGLDAAGYSTSLRRSVAARLLRNHRWLLGLLLPWVRAHTLDSCNCHPHLTVTCRYRWPSAFAGFCFSFSFRSSSLSKRGITCSSRLLQPPVARHCDWHSYTFLILRAQFPNSSSQFIVAYFCLNVVSVQM